MFVKKISDRKKDFDKFEPTNLDVTGGIELYKDNACTYVLQRFKRSL